MDRIGVNVIYVDRNAYDDLSVDASDLVDGVANYSAVNIETHHLRESVRRLKEAFGEGLCHDFTIYLPATNS